MINARFPFLVALCAALFFAFCSVAKAETIAATTMGGFYYPSINNSVNNKQETAALSCTVGIALAIPGHYGTWHDPYCWHYDQTGYRLDMYLQPSNSPVLSCPAGQNWTLNGSTCTRPDCLGSETRDSSTGVCLAACPVGEERNSSGVCVKDCTGKVGQSTPSPSYEFLNGGVPAVGGCAVNCSNWRQSGGGTLLLPLMQVGDSCTYTGASSDGETTTEGTGFKPTPKAPTSPKDCIGSGMGYIQGSTGTTCVPQGEAPEGQKPEYKGDSAKESGTPGTDGKPDPGAPDYEKEEKKIETKDGKIIESIKTTTNGTPDGNGGTTCPEGFTLVAGSTQCSKTTTTTSTPNDFCTANPTSPACKGTKEGDECIKFPDRVGCVDLGASPDTPAINEEERGVSAISPVDLTQINSCPQGMLLPKGLGYYDFGPMCDFASALKPVILAIAWLSAFFIVLGFSQGDD